MPVDARIALGVQPVKIESPMDNMLRMMQMQQMKQSGEMNQMRMQKYQQDQTRETEMRNALANTPDLDSAITVARQHGDVATLQALGKMKADEAAQAEHKAKAEKAQHELMRDAIAGADMSSPEKYDRWRSNYLTLHPEDEHAVPPADQWSPDLQRRLSLTANQQFDAKYKDRMASVAEGNAAETARYHTGQLANSGRVAAASERRATAAETAATAAQDAKSPEAIRAKAEAKARGEAKVANEQALPSALDSIAEMKASFDEFEKLPGFNATYGTVSGSILSPSLRQDSVNADAKREQVVGMLSLENRSKLKGSGAISDFEFKTLAKAATILGNPRIDPETARAEIKRVKGILDTAEKRMRKMAGDTSGKPNTMSKEYPADVKTDADRAEYDQLMGRD